VSDASIPCLLRSFPGLVGLVPASEQLPLWAAALSIISYSAVFRCDNRLGQTEDMIFSVPRAILDE
jgi:hypothetical protein